MPFAIRRSLLLGGVAFSFAAAAQTAYPSKLVVWMTTAQP